MKLLLVLCGLISLASCAHRNRYESGDYATSTWLKKSAVPFAKGTRFTVRQGAFGSSSHSDDGNEFFWDLEVPWGTDVIAPEEGKVFYLHRPMDGGGGCDSKYAEDAWNVLIENTDGTVAQFTHVDGVVKIGEAVRAGQLIGKTIARGNVCYPHLHYGVYRSRDRLYNSLERASVPLSFTGLGDGWLRQGQTYVVP